MLIKICIRDEKPIKNILFACQSNDVEYYTLANSHFLLVLDRTNLNLNNQKIKNKMKNVYYESQNYTIKKFIFFKKKFANYNGIIFDNYFYLKLYDYCLLNKIKINYIKYNSINENNYDIVIYNGFNELKIKPSIKNDIVKETYESLFEKIKNNEDIVIDEISININNRPLIFLKTGYIINTTHYSYFDDNKEQIIEILNNGL